MSKSGKLNTGRASGNNMLPKSKHLRSPKDRPLGSLLVERLDKVHKRPGYILITLLEDGHGSFAVTSTDALTGLVTIDVRVFGPESKAALNKRAMDILLQMEIGWSE